MAKQGTQDFHVIAHELAKDVPDYLILDIRIRLFSEQVCHPHIHTCIAKAVDDFFLPTFNQKQQEEKRLIRKLRQSYNLSDHWIKDRNEPICPCILDGIRRHSLDQLRTQEIDPKIVASMAAMTSTILKLIGLLNCSPT